MWKTRLGEITGLVKLRSSEVVESWNLNPGMFDFKVGCLDLGTIDILARIIPVVGEVLCRERCLAASQACLCPACVITKHVPPTLSDVPLEEMCPLLRTTV